MELTELFLRIAIGFLTLLVLARIMGRKEIAQMTFFNFVSAIAIGSITGALVTNSNFSIRNGILALVGWAIFTVAMGFIDIKSKKARVLIEGQPLIVVKDGQIMEDTLRKVRLDVDALNAMLRQQNVYTLADVEYAIFETNGKLSVLKKESKKSLTKGDMAVQPTPQMYTMPTEVITDGTVITRNLKSLNLDQAWLEQQLKNSGVNSISEVFFAQVQTDGSLYIDVKQDQIH
ncbi:DUF421 domain-containing protein [Cytobacillus suaedae]|nr:DUF421 domain-containing protein [Cytobacillus suaedae]